ncbi:hypothetical protein [Nocardioides convexus]|uniref:hypothetical protein n=1 Tax=Nocardioides convexus TaxID=2712224 RepID=UPI0024187C1D|nr:hypothetical protein [Nocardioides convexus]
MLLPKPQALRRRRDGSRADPVGLAALRAGHRDSPSLAIDRRLTLLAFEAMNHWTRDGAVGLHVFHKNNESRRVLLGDPCAPGWPG